MELRRFTIEVDGRPVVIGLPPDVLSALAEAVGGAAPSSVSVPPPSPVSVPASSPVSVVASSPASVPAPHQVRGRDAGRDSSPRHLGESRDLEPPATASAVVTPVSGVLARRLAETGALVTKGQDVAVVETLKTELRLRAPRGGRLGAWQAQIGAPVSADDVLVGVA
jgi:biotin carboxyl carrier protein